MRKTRREICRRVRRAVAAAAVAVFAGIVALLAVTAGFDARDGRAIRVSQEPLNNLSRIKRQPPVLGVSGMERYVQATAPVVYKPAQPPQPIAPPAPPNPTAAVVYRIPTAEPVVFITIDDGVTPDKAGLALMRQKKAVATLFLNQVNVHKHRDYYKQWQDSGSSIQNHTLSHPHLPKMRPDGQQHEICTNAEWLKAEYGTNARLLRPPYGEFNDATRQVAGSCGQKYIVHWTAVVEKGHIAYARGSMQPGEILLLHFTPDLAHDLQAVFTDAETRGFRVGRLEDWLL